MERIGYVNRIIGDKAEVEIKRVSACGSGGCSSCAGACDVPSTFVTMPNTLEAKVGNFVEIKAKGKKMLQYTFIAYMIPFFMLVLGIIAGIQGFKHIGYANYEALGFLTGLIFLVLSFLIIRKIDQKIARTKKSQFEMIRIL